MAARSVTSIRIAKYGYIAVSILFCLAGIALLIPPVESAMIIGSFLGYVLIAFGIIKVIGYFSGDLFRLAFQHDLQLGIMLILMGLVTLLRTENMLNIICVMVGMGVVVDCIFMGQTAIEAKHFGIKKWWITFALSVLSGLLGIFLIFCPSDGTVLLISLLGALLLIEGLRNLCIALTCVKIVKHQMPDTVDRYY